VEPEVLVPEVVVPEVVVPDVLVPEVLPLVVPEVVVPVVLVPVVEPDVVPSVVPDVLPLEELVFSEAVQELNAASDEHSSAPESTESSLRFIRSKEMWKEKPV